MAKKKETVPTIIDSVETLEAKMKAMREAQKIFATYTQEQVDKIFFEAAMAANKIRIPLAKMAVEETGMGIVEDKVIKNHYAAEYIYNAYQDYKDLWCDRRRSLHMVLRRLLSRSAWLRASYSYNKPDIYSNFQNTDLLEDKKCNHHQPTSDVLRTCTIAAAKAGIWKQL